MFYSGFYSKTYWFGTTGLGINIPIPYEMPESSKTYWFGSTGLGVKIPIPCEVLRSPKTYWFGTTGFGIQIPIDPSDQMKQICPPTYPFASFCFRHHKADSFKLINGNPVVEFIKPSTESRFRFVISRGEQVPHSTMPGMEVSANAHLDDEEPMDWEDEFTSAHTWSARIPQLANIDSGVNQSPLLYPRCYNSAPQSRIPLLYPRCYNSAPQSRIPFGPWHREHREKHLTWPNTESAV